LTSALTTSASAGFAKQFGSTPEGVWSAPGRVNLIGEHTDYNEGFVLPFAINRRTYAAVSTRSDGIARVASSFTNEVVEIPLTNISDSTVSGWSAYPLGVAWALIQAGAKPTGFDLYVDSDVPVGAGLSSSAAIECSVAMALNDLWQADLDRAALAKIGQRAENEIVGAPTGIMDQTASLFGVLDHAVFLDCRSLVAEAIPLGLKQNSLEIVVMDTKFPTDLLMVDTLRVEMLVSRVPDKWVFLPFAILEFQILAKRKQFLSRWFSKEFATLSQKTRESLKLSNS
jgi:galactokinase